MPTVYVTGHRNPDTDSIASAIGYAELKGRLDPEQRVRRRAPRRAQPADALGARTQRRATARAPPPRDAPRRGPDGPTFPASRRTIRCARPASRWRAPTTTSSRSSTRAARSSALVTTRALARRYIRESRDTSTLREATYVNAIAEVLEGEVLTGENKPLSGRVWVHAMAVSSPSGISEGDVVVIGNRADAQHLVIELGAALLVTSNGAQPSRRSWRLPTSAGRPSSSRPLTPTSPAG